METLTFYVNVVEVCLGNTVLVITCAEQRSCIRTCCIAVQWDVCYTVCKNVQ